MGDYVLKNASEYVAIRATSVALRVGADLDISFDYSLPEGVLTDEFQVLSFHLIKTRDVRLRVTNNGALVHVHTYVDGGERSVVDVVAAFARSGPNRMDFELESGTIEFSNVAVWYKRDAVVTPPRGLPTFPTSWFRKPNINSVISRIKESVASRRG